MNRPTKDRRHYLRGRYRWYRPARNRAIGAAAWWLTMAGRRRRGEFYYATRAERIAATRDAIAYSRRQRHTGTR